MKTRLGKEIRRSLFTGLWLSLFLFAAEASAYASTVRGMLFRRDGYGRAYAAPYVPVTLENGIRGRSSVAYSGTDGMYYLYNVPPGDYYLQIWLNPNEPLVYRITVANGPYTDIAQIQIP